MSKPRNGRRYNPEKARKANFSLNVRRTAKKFLTAWSVGMKQPAFFDTEGNPIKGNLDAKRFCMSQSLPWSSLCMVLCRKQDGQNYMQSVFVKSPEPHTYMDLAETLNSAHQDLIKNANPQHVLNTGWVSSPAGFEITPELGDKIMDQLNAWDWLAKWEAAGRDDVEVFNK